MTPADPASYCPVCGLSWYVRGCKPGECKGPEAGRLAFKLNVRLWQEAYTPEIVGRIAALGLGSDGGPWA